MTIGVQQGSVLSPMLSVIYIGNLNENSSDTICTFADDIIIGGLVGSEEGCLKLQCNLNQLRKYAKECQMKFNLNTYEVMHFAQGQE